VTSGIEDRRQRAREAFYDTPGCVADPDSALTPAIEVATQVKITDEAIEAAWMAQPVAAREMAEMDLDDMREVVTAALTALGFEVVD
jgi:hypothetical protein